jgi:hypothetical protein
MKTFPGFSPANTGAASDITETTTDNQGLSHDFLVAIKRSAMAHTSAEHQQAAMSLLQEDLMGIDGNDLIKNGKGFELYQTRVKTGFTRGLGTETITNLRAFIHAVQQNHETVGAFFKHLQQLYEQVQITKGCEIGNLTRNAFALEGLTNGAYHEVLAPFVRRVQLGQGKVKFHSATMGEIQSAATNVLVSSRYYRDHAIQAGRLPVKARAAGEAPRSPSPSSKDSDPMVDRIIDRIRTKMYFTPDMCDWIQQNYRCVQCWRNGHIMTDYHRLRTHWNITAKSSASKTTSRGPTPSTSGGAACQTQISFADPVESKSEKAKVANAAPGEQTSKEMPTLCDRLSASSSEADESDDAFATYDTLTTNDDDLLRTITQVTARKAEDTKQCGLLHSGNIKPIPIKDRVVACIGKTDTT